MQVFKVVLLSGVPQILPSRATQPDGAAGHTADHTASGVCPRVAGSQTVPADIKGARTKCSGAAVRSVKSFFKSFIFQEEQDV